MIYDFYCKLQLILLVLAILYLLKNIYNIIKIISLKSGKFEPNSQQLTLIGCAISYIITLITYGI